MPQFSAISHMDVPLDRITSRAPNSSNRPGDRREEILAKATAIVADKGFHGFSIQEVATACGLTKAGLLHYAGSKENLLISVLQNRDATNSLAVQELLEHRGITAETDMSDRNKVMEVFSAIVEYNARQPEMVRLYVMLRCEAIWPEHPAHAFFQQRDEASLTMFRRLLGGFEDRSPGIGLSAFVLMTGLETRWLQTGERMNLLAEWQRSFDLLLPG